MCIRDRALASPRASSRILRALMMVPTPMLMAWRGTSDSLLKKRVLALMVDSVRSVSYTHLDVYKRQTG